MANEFIARKGLIALDDTQITGSLGVSGSLELKGSGSTLFNIVGSEGTLFSITDSLSGSLFAVSDVSGLPILEVFSDDTVKIGSFNDEAITVSGSHTTIGGVLAIPGFTNVSSSLAAATAGGGTITGVTAGDGLTGGGSTGTVTLNVVGGTGITANANDIAVDATIATVVQLNASSSALQTNIDGKQATLTFGKLSGNALKSEEALTTNDVLLMGASNVKGRTYSEFRGDINVEDGADVTDATNVAAAGALMDSELSEIATVKALTATGISGSFTAASASFSTRVAANDAKLTANTTNVTSAGALMDSEVTNLAQVKAFDSSDYATAAQGSTADSAQQPPSEGAFVNGDKTKLDGIEASADVTDTSNVTSAGALMDSEVTNLAQVKAFDSSDYATSAQGTKADNAATVVQLNASSSALQTNIDGKQATLTFGKSSGNALKSEEALTTNDVLLMGSSNVKGRTYSQFRSDINVEDGADVTDTTNVTAAGALMDSELTDLAGVKGVTISTLQVKPSEGAFANGDKTKLDGIEASADVTDTTNVTSAGALMDSEVTNLAQVKAFDSSDYATSAQGTKADSAQQPPSEGAFANGDKTKLDGIEASADVTDTANVTSAGALMDSEVTNLAQVKAFDSSDYATAAQGTKADSAIQPADTASFAITGSDVSFGHLSSSQFQVGTLDRPFKITGGGSFAATRPTIEGIGGYINVDSGINLTGEYKLSFDNDVTNTYIKANSDNPEDLEIHADQDIILNPDNAVDIQGILSIPGFNDVSASLAAASGGGGGDITGVTAGNGLTGGGSSGDVTLTVGAGTGVTVNSGDIAIGQAVSTTSNVTFANITASGNISASGTGYFNAIRMPQDDGTGTQKLYFGSAPNDDNGYLYDDGDNLRLGYNDSDILSIHNVTPHVSVTGNLQVFGGGGGNITASGDISASGTFTSNGVTVDATGFGAADNALQVVNSSGTSIFEVEGTGDVTANQSGRVAAFNIVRVAAGAQSAPSIAFTSDTNTGIYAPSSDQINIQAGGGTTELFVNTSGVTVNNGTFTIPGFSDVSASLAAASGGGGGATTYRTVIESSCFLAQNTLRYLPFNSLSEQTSFNYLSITPAAADGKLISITLWPQSSGGSTVAGLHLNSNATATTTVTETISAGTPLTFTFSSGNTFSQNDELSFSLDPTNNINGLAAQIVLEYDL